MLCVYVDPDVVRFKLYECRGLLLWVSVSNPGKGMDIGIFFICFVLCMIGLCDEIVALSE